MIDKAMNREAPSFFMNTDEPIKNDDRQRCLFSRESIHLTRNMMEMAANIPRMKSANPLDAYSRMWLLEKRTNDAIAAFCLLIYFLIQK